MPIVAVSPSTFTHSCVFEYFRSAGPAMAPLLSVQLRSQKTFLRHDPDDIALAANLHGELGARLAVRRFDVGHRHGMPDRGRVDSAGDDARARVARIEIIP